MSTAGQPAGLPTGFAITVDLDTKQLDDTTLFGGSPSRIMRLSPAGVRAWAELQTGAVASPGAAALARRLTDAGLAHPSPPPSPGPPPDVTVLIPVHDRAELLDRCLTALGNGHPVLVVDDGSADPRAIADVAARHGARVLRRDVNGGPGAARNAGLAMIDTAFVAMLDSDCVPGAGWIDALAGQLADPLVAAVAPRIVATPATGTAGRYGASCGSLDLGDRPALVVPSTRVSYVPTAALLVRRSALRDVSGDRPVFDPHLRYGEDVDLVWRLNRAGWRIRYEPTVRVGHREPDRWRELLARRYHYGTSAGPLSRRHPTAMAPLVLQPWPAVAVLSITARRPVAAIASCVVAAATLHRAVRRAGVPTAGVLDATRTAVVQTYLGTGRYAGQFAGLAVLGTVLWPRSEHGLGRRAALATLLLAPPVTLWRARRPELDPVRFVAANLADQAAYGAGVYAGCLRIGTVRPLRPRLSRRPVRISQPARTEQPATPG